MPAIPEPVWLKPRVNEFLTYCEARNLSPNSIRAYRSDLADFIALSGGGESTVGKINRKLIRRVVVQLHERKTKEGTVRKKLAAVKSFCKWLQAEGLLDASLIESISGPRRRDNLPDVPNETEIKNLLDGDIPTASPERDRVMLELLYGSGLRAAELVGINLDDFRDEDFLIVRGKGRKERNVIVGEYAQAAIRAWLPVRFRLLAQFNLETPALLFSVGPKRSAERLDVRSVGRVVKAVAEGKGLDPAKWHPHLLRHACATHSHDHNAPLQWVATFSGPCQTLNRADLYASFGRTHDADIQSGAPARAGLKSWPVKAMRLAMNMKKWAILIALLAGAASAQDAVKRMPSDEEITELLNKASEKVTVFQKAVALATPSLDQIDPKLAVNYADSAATAEKLIETMKTSGNSAYRLVALLTTLDDLSLDAATASVRLLTLNAQKTASGGTDLPSLSAVMSLSTAETGCFDISELIAHATLRYIGAEEEILNHAASSAPPSKRHE